MNLNTNFKIVNLVRVYVSKMGAPPETWNEASEGTG